MGEEHACDPASGPFGTSVGQTCRMDHFDFGPCFGPFSTMGEAFENPSLRASWRSRLLRNSFDCQRVSKKYPGTRFAARKDSFSLIHSFPGADKKRFRCSRTARWVALGASICQIGSALPVLVVARTSRGHHWVPPGLRTIPKSVFCPKGRSPRDGGLHRRQAPPSRLGMDVLAAPYASGNRYPAVISR